MGESTDSGSGGTGNGSGREPQKEKKETKQSETGLGERDRGAPAKPASKPKPAAKPRREVRSAPKVATRDPFADSGKSEGLRADARGLPDYKKRETEALRKASFVSGDESFVKGGRDSKEVTDAQGNPVLTRQGVERQAAFQQEELERVISKRQGGQGDPEVEKRKMAREIIEEKLANPQLPGFLGGVAKINLENQLRQLEAGGDPTFTIGPDGTFTTTGVRRPGEEGDGIAPNITSPLEEMMDRDDERDEPTIMQPAEEDILAEDVTGALGAEAPRGRRGTRSKRPGRGGTLLEGGGVLYE